MTCGYINATVLRLSRGGSWVVVSQQILDAGLSPEMELAQKLIDKIFRFVDIHHLVENKCVNHGGAARFFWLEAAVRFVAEFLQFVFIWHRLIRSMNIRPLAEKGARWLAILLPWGVLGYGLRFSVGGIPSTMLEVYLFVLFFAFTVTRGWTGWRDAWRELPYRWLLFAWVVVGFFAALWSPVVLKGLGLWRAYLLEPVITLAVVQRILRTEQDRAFLRLAFWTVTIFISVWALVQFVTGWRIPSPWNVSIANGRRATGPYGFPNAVALYIAPIVAYAGARCWMYREKLAGLAAGLGLLAVLAARSDGGTLAILCAWGFVLVATRFGRGLLAVGGVLAIVGVLLRPDFAHEVWLNLTFHGWSGEVRLIMWGETWELLKAHWFLGAGIGGYPVLFDTFRWAKFIEIFQYPHQFVFTAWSEVGLPGLALFLGLLWTWGVRAWHSASRFAERSTGFAPLVAVVVHGLVDVPYWKNDLAVTFFVLWWIVAWVDQPATSTLGSRR